MALPQQGTSPSAPTQPPTTGQGFFIPQSTVGQAKNISESPVLSKPAGSKTAQTKKTNNPGRQTLVGLGLIIVLIIIGAGGIGLYSSRSNNQLPPEETAPTVNSAKINISPSSITIPGGDDQTVDFSLNLLNSPVELSSLEFSVQFSGEVPNEILFSPAQLPNFNPADAAVTESDSGKNLTVKYSSAANQSFLATTETIELGRLSFIAPASGEMTVQISSSDSKVIMSQSGVDILQPTNTITYTFESTITPSPDLAFEEDQASISASKNLIASPSASVNKSLLATPSASLLSPTVAIKTSASITVVPTKTSIPTKTPTPTPTQKPTSTIKATPTVTSARQSSIPAEIQEKPVSGSLDHTIALIASGSLFIMIGLLLWKKSPPIQAPPEHNR